MTNWLVGNDMSILVTETIRISMFFKTVSDKRSILFLIEFMLIWLIMILFRLFILNFFNVSLKLSSTDWQVVETDPLIFLDTFWEISWSLRIRFLNVKFYVRKKSQRRCRLWYWLTDAVASFHPSKLFNKIYEIS